MWMNILITHYFKNFIQRDNKSVCSAISVSAYRNDVNRKRIPLNMTPKNVLFRNINL
jgi:hypothetical protein